MTRSRPKHRSSSHPLFSQARALCVLPIISLFAAGCASTPERSPAVPEIEPQAIESQAIESRTFVSQADLSAAEADQIFLREEMARRSAWSAPRRAAEPEPVVETASPEPAPARRIELDDVQPMAPATDPMAPTFGTNRPIEQNASAPASGLRRSSVTPRPDAIPESTAPLRATPQSTPDPIAPVPEGSTPAAPLRNFRDLYRNPGPAVNPAPASRTRRITLAEEADQLRNVARSAPPVQSGRRVVSLPGAPTASGSGETTGQIGWHGAREAAKRGPAVDGRQGVMMDLLLGDRNRIRVH